MKHRSNLRGFTLIELMVVVVIIALLAALVIPALQMAQAHSMARNCLSRARSIAGAVAAYATAWEGWTNRDPDHYVKSFGYRLRSDRGYFGEDPGTWVSAQSSSGPLKAESESESYAQKVKDFRCQADPVPRLTRHAIPSSYHVYAAFAGKNVMGLSSASNRILVVREAHKRHPLDSDNMERHYVFADLHASLGYTGPPLPGLYARWWNLRAGEWNNVIFDKVTATPDFEDVWAHHMEEHYFWFLPELGNDDRWGEIPHGGSTGQGYEQHVHAGGIEWGGHGDPDWIMCRMDGFITFKESGVWNFYESTDNYVFIWIDVNGNGLQDANETAQDLNYTAHNFLIGVNVKAGKAYRFAYAFHENVLGNYFHLYWKAPSQDAPSIGPIGGEISFGGLTHVP